MRNLLVYMVITLMLTGCEIIGGDERLIPVSETTGGTRNHVLLEFTGFRCVNCPNAAKIAEELAEQYDGQLITVSLHPASNPFTQGLYDYTCPAADSVYTFLGGTASTPFPAGNLNIHSYEGDYFIHPSEWATMVYTAMRDSAAPYLHVYGGIPYSTSHRDVTGTVSLAPNTQANLACWLVEDSVVGVQAMPDGSFNNAYYHRHVLRAAWKDQAFGVPVSSTAMSYMIPIPEECDIKHLSIVALLIDPKDKHILNAYEKKLTGHTEPDND